MKRTRTISARDRKDLHRAIVRWFRSNARPLPWRKTRDPYKILLSEVMLQQTQVSRVEGKYRIFLRQFPTIHALAKSTPAQVIVAWSGMGYNNRAIRLRSLAQAVVSENRALLPTSVESLQKLPGIGKYTSHAIACFAFGKNVPVVDTNIRRVFGRLFPTPNADVWAIAERNLPSRSVYEWNQGLMELGATICRSSSPRCQVCPVKRYCPSAFSPLPAASRKFKSEPGRNGIPNRIFRGRIVEVLRRRGRSGIAIDRMGRMVKHDFTKRDRVWLAGLLSRLERDGLVKTTKRGGGISVKLAS